MRGKVMSSDLSVPELEEDIALLESIILRHQAAYNSSLRRFVSGLSKVKVSEVINLHSQNHNDCIKTQLMYNSLTVGDLQESLSVLSIELQERRARQNAESHS